MNPQTETVSLIMLKDQVEILRQALYEIKDSPLSREEMIERAERALRESEWSNFDSKMKKRRSPLPK